MCVMSKQLFLILASCIKGKLGSQGASELRVCTSWLEVNDN